MRGVGNTHNKATYLIVSILGNDYFILIEKNDKEGHMKPWV